MHLSERRHDDDDEREREREREGERERGECRKDGGELFLMEDVCMCGEFGSMGC
jgi:hypothetical protein